MSSTRNLEELVQVKTRAQDIRAVCRYCVALWAFPLATDPKEPFSFLSHHRDLLDPDMNYPCRAEGIWKLTEKDGSRERVQEAVRNP